MTRRLWGVLGAAAFLMCGLVAPASAAGPLDPVGNLDGFSVGSRIQVSGWTFDPETAAPIDVHAYVDGRIAAVGRADQLRYDVAGAYPWYGPRHGWSFSLPRPGAGAHAICVYALNVGQGTTNPAVGCRSFTVAGNAALNPLGSLDSLAVTSNGLSFGGWTLDPETPAAIDVHAYLDGRLVSVTRAGAARFDIAAAFPAYGADHGYSGLLPVPTPGVHTFCTYAINVGDGTRNPQLGCRSFSVGQYSPVSFGATAQLPRGLDVRASQPRRVPISEFACCPAPGEVAVFLTVSVTNTSSRPYELVEDVIMLAGALGVSADLVYDFGGSNPDNGLPGRVLAGATVSGTYLFGVQPADLGRLVLVVAPDFLADDAVVFAGSA